MNPTGNSEGRTSKETRTKVNCWPLRAKRHRSIRYKLDEKTANSLPQYNNYQQPPEDGEDLTGVEDPITPVHITSHESSNTHPSAPSNRQKAQLDGEKEREKPEDAALLAHLTKGDEITILDKWGKRKNRVIFIDDRTTILRKFSNSMFAFDGTKRLIPLREVGNIIDGAHTESFQRHGIKGAENRCFSLVYDNGCKTIDFLCSDPGVKKAWVHGLTLIISRLMPTVQTAEDIAQSYFQLADVNNDGRLSVDEVCGLLKRLHLSLDRRYVKHLFKMVEAESSIENKDNHLDRHEFLQFVKILYHCKEIEDIYESAKGGNEYLNVSNFMAFLGAHQKQALAQSAVEKLMRRHELSVSLRGSDLLGYEGFRSYLMSDDNSLIKPEASTIYQDMTQPLTSYWMFSSHNTYLIGNQLTGESSTNGYIASLTRGCRCVEIDCWDGDEGEPVVTHGHTLTSKLLFRDVIEAIKKAAFVTTPYPVLVSLENHCSQPQQRKMAEHIKSIFGENLVTSLLDPTDPSKMLSPEALKGKFLVKGKIVKPTLAKQTSVTSVSTSSLQQQSRLATQPSLGEDDSLSPSLLDQTVVEDQTTAEKKGKAEKVEKTAKELSDITAVPSAHMPKLDGDFPTKPLPFAAVSSLVESDILDLVKANDNDKLLQHTNKYFIRVYPAGLRTNSGNYNPMPGLIAGCQIVALNFQTLDKYYKIYDGFFSDNGSCGYILKQFAAPVSPPMTIIVKVIAGYQLGKTDDTNVRDIIDPYVLLRMYGVLEDMNKFQTAAVKDNGFNPTWNDQFTFKVTRPDVAILRFIVMDENTVRGNNYIAQYSLPVRLIRQGFRFIRLDCEHSSCASLLVQVTIA